MRTCPAGHPSSTDDYCDQCGVPLAPASAGPGSTNRSHRTELLLVPPPTPAGGTCPVCAAPQRAGDRYCEHCGADLAAASAGAPPAVWVAEVAADREYFDRVAPEGLRFPAGRVVRVFRLDADEVLIGRRSASRGVDPEIDLSEGLEDPAVSHGHARIVRTGDGGLAIVDLGSTNGTTLNDEAIAFTPDAPVVLADGDRVHLGAWTTITVRLIEPRPEVVARPSSAQVSPSVGTKSSAAEFMQ